MKDFDKLSEEKQIAHIDQKIHLCPYTKNFKTWIITKLDEPSKLLAFYKAQQLQQEMEEYVRLYPQTKKSGVVAHFALKHMSEHKTKSIYIAIMFALMNSPVLQACYYDLHTNKDTGLKDEVFSRLLPDREIINKVKSNDLF